MFRTSQWFAHLLSLPVTFQPAISAGHSALKPPQRGCFFQNDYARERRGGGLLGVLGGEGEIDSADVDSFIWVKVMAKSIHICSDYCSDHVNIQSFQKT